MKKLTTLLFMVSAISFIACKTEKKEKKKNTIETEKSTAAFSLSDAATKVNWTAYKTTEKVPVTGQFKKVNIISGGAGNTIKEAINDVAFSIPVSSIFTSDTSRDFKIRKFFFGVMEKTNILSGKFIIENDSLGYANLTMNGVTEKLPFDYTVEGKQFSMTATMDVLKWKTQSPMDSLNVACKDLHKGLDGISKTWSEVAIHISSTFK
ncbi:MAG: hypothetical protein GKR88_16405 [Flavobacteriaceae bacterium]|nr:MAG: hypothetical protein GKR88_16405 [Flavobacteriaceae bacterium]